MSEAGSTVVRKRYRTRVWIGVDAVTGKKIYAMPGAYTMEELDIKVEELEKTYKTDKLTHTRRSKSKKLTLDSYASNWYELYKEPFLRESTKNMYINILNNHISPHIGHYPPAAISADMLQKFLLRYRSSSKSLIDKILMVLRQIFGSAYEDGLIQRNPTKRLRKPQGTQGERKPMAMADIKTLVTQAKSHPDGLLPILMLFTGMRRGEALGLRWEDIKGDRIHVSEAVVFNDSNRPTVGLPKTEAAVRTIPILWPALADMLRDGGEGYVFGGDSPWSYTKFIRTWERLQRDIPVLKGVSAHVLRHSFVMLLRRGGVDPVTAQHLLGHSDYETTANIYTHIVEEDFMEADALMQKSLAGLFD